MFCFLSTHRNFLEPFTTDKRLNFSRLPGNQGPTSQEKSKENNLLAGATEHLRGTISWQTAFSMDIINNEKEGISEKQGKRWCGVLGRMELQRALNGSFNF
jgi:hypothetical protein